jgi:hypothetical protein
MPNCVARHSSPATATTGHLCDNHYQRTLNQIHDIHDALTLLPYFLEPGSLPDNNQIRGRNIDPPAPIRLEVITILDRRTTQHHPNDPVSVAHLFHTWATWIRQQRQLARQPSTVSGDLGTLHRNLEWVAGTDRITDLITDLRSIHRAIRDAIGDHAPRPVGRCPVMFDTGTCDGKLFQDRYTALSVTCSSCGERWGEDELRRLGLILAAGA